MTCRGRPSGGLVRASWRAVQELRELVLAVECGGCRSGGARWCDGCAGQVSAPATRHLPDGLAVVSAGRYDGVLREALNVWKDHGRADLTRPFTGLLGEVLAGLAPPGEVLLVPVPSSVRSRRSRGREPVRELCVALGRAQGLPVVPVLRQARLVHDQAGLRAGQRSVNLHAALACVGGWRGRVAGRPVLLVDDIVTTGSTLAEAARVLRGSSAAVVGALTVAATPLREDRTRRPDG